MGKSELVLYLPLVETANICLLLNMSRSYSNTHLTSFQPGPGGPFCPAHFSNLSVLTHALVKLGGKAQHGSRCVGAGKTQKYARLTESSEKSLAEGSAIEVTEGRFEKCNVTQLTCVSDMSTLQ